jgi:hypothetical protein
MVPKDVTLKKPCEFRVPVLRHLIQGSTKLEISWTQTVCLNVNARDDRGFTYEYELPFKFLIQKMMSEIRM